LKPLLTLSILFCFSLFNATAQKWTVKKPFEQNVFIENKGQFNVSKRAGIKRPVLYYTEKGNIQLFYTANSVVFEYDSLILINDTNEKETEHDRPKVKAERKFMTMHWDGANLNPTVEVKEQVSNYFTYPNFKDKAGKSGILAHAWKKLIYHNLYSGIDVEFYYPSDKGGVEYNIIVHPGADISKFKLKYSGAKLSLKDGNVIIASPCGEYTDHKPVIRLNGNHISSSFKVENNIISLQVDKHSPKDSLVIDPWITSTQYAVYNRVYSVDYDVKGNVYICGGAFRHEYQIQKYNSKGILEWTYSSTLDTPMFSIYYYSQLAVDHRNGTSYFGQAFDDGNGCEIIKIDSSGMRTGIVNTYQSEIWRISFDYCNNELVIGGGTPQNAPIPFPRNMAFTVDTGFTKVNSVNVLNTTEYFHDVTLQALDGVGHVYMATSNNNGAPYWPSFENVFLRLPLPSLSPTAYIDSDGHNFVECQNIYYYPPIWYVGSPYGRQGNGFNGMAANTTMLLTYDGKELKKWRPSNGAYVDSVSVSNQYFYWAGIDIDYKGEIYVGNETNVVIYDSALHQVSSPIPCADSVYDLKLNNKGMLFTCGANFVEADSVPLVKMAYATCTSPTSCSACNGTATATGIGTPPFTYKWSNGATTKTITGLCPGIYTVTITNGLCLPDKDTAIVTISNKVPYVPSVVDTNPVNCVLPNGSITAFPAESTYVWSNGETTQKDTGLSAGTYSVTVTDSNGCKSIMYGTLLPQPVPVIVITPQKDSLCIGASVSITSSGVKTYTWSPSAGLSCNTCSAFIASPTVTTTYTVFGVDSEGCTTTAYLPVLVKPIPVLTISLPVDTDCIGSAINIFASAASATSYTWSPASGLSCTNCSDPSASVSVPTTYTVTASNGNCSTDSTIYIPVKPSPFVIHTLPYYSCSGDTTTIKASGSTSYLWSNGATTDSIVVAPKVTTVYYVTAFNNCLVYDTVKVYSVNVKKSVNSICLGDSMLLTSTAPGTASYSWAPAYGLSCYSCASAMASPASTTTYTLTATDSSGCSVSGTVIVYLGYAPATTVTLSTGKDSVCFGNKIIITINATGPGNIEYNWYASPGLTCSYCSSNTVSPLVSTTYTVSVTDLYECPVIDTIPITVLPSPPPITLTNDTICIGDSVRLDTIPVLGGPYTYLWSPTAGLSCTTCPSPMATPTVGAYYSLSVSNANCTNVATMALVVSTPPVIYPVSYTENICQGGTTTIYTGIPYTYKFTWIPATGLSCSTCNNPTADPSYSTTYTLSIVNGKCVLDTTYPVIVFHPVVTAAQGAVCAGDTAVLTATVLNALGSTTYDWTTGDYTNTLVVEPLTTTTYSVGIRNGACYFDTTMTVTVTPPPNADISGLTALCAGDSTTLTANGGYNYVWSTGTTASSLTVKPIKTTSYTLKVSNGSCTKDTSITITVNPLPIGAVTGNTAVCADSSTTLTASGGSSYYWSTAATTSSITVSPTTPSTYNVVVSQNGCADTIYTHVNVNAAPLVTVCCDTSIAAGKSVQLTSSGGGTYLWSPSNGLSCSSCSDPVASPLVTTIYTLTVSSDSGCSAQQIISIDVLCGTVFVPDAFSPNGDGQNDYLYVRCDCIKAMQFDVFDRWGNKVFETTNQNIPWDGRYRGEPMNTGTYEYYLTATMYDGTTQTKKGNVTLVR